jgi:hypothetical protein
MGMWSCEQKVENKAGDSMDYLIVADKHIIMNVAESWECHHCR